MKPLTPDADGWLDAGPVTVIPPGTAISIPYKNIQIAIFHQPDGFFAVKNACPHAGDPLCRGTVEDGIVTCPGHNWQFRLNDGACLRGNEEYALRTFPVEVRENHVFLRVAM
jgi:nitrite reductase (NADH) small subunit